MARYGPEGKAARLVPNSRRDPQNQNADQSLLDKQNLCNFDRVDYWLDRYLIFLEREMTRLSAGPIGQHYLRCASAAYADFQAAPSQAGRYRAWNGVVTCCQWIAQLREVCA